MRGRAALARAAATRSISPAPRDAREAALERSLASFLALEGCDLKVKFKGLFAQDLGDRAALGCAALEERKKLLVAKLSLRAALGGVSGREGEESGTERSGS